MSCILRQYFTMSGSTTTQNQTRSRTVSAMEGFPWEGTSTGTNDSVVVSAAFVCSDTQAHRKMCFTNDLLLIL